MQNLQQYIIQLTQSLLGDIKNDIGGDILFGALGGSYSLGLQNHSSDIDFFLCVDKVDFRDVKCLHKDIPMDNTTSHIEYYCVPYSELLDDICQYSLQKKKYPTVMHRTAEEQQRNVQRPPVKGPDYKISVLFRILLSDVVLNKSEAHRRKDEFCDGIKIVDIIDYHFTRLYGNYVEKVEGQDTVPLRKYLYMIHQACTCMKLMQTNEKPPMDFLDLVGDTIQDNALKNQILHLYDINRHAYSGKLKEMTEKNSMLNQFLKDNINLVEGYLRQNRTLDRVLVF